MSRKKKIFLFILVVLIFDVSYTATVFNYDRFFRVGAVSTYIEDVTCGLVGGEMSEFYHDCYLERECFLLYKDGGKPCQNSTDCQGKCVISDVDIVHYCGPNATTGYLQCAPELIGKCETHYDQRHLDYNSGVLEPDWSGGCGL